MASTPSIEREFEQVALKAKIDMIEDIDGLREIAKKLIDVNYGMKDQFKQWIEMGWLK